MIDFKELIKCGVHFGHKTSRWSPKMAPFIWGAKNKIHLIDISKTAYLLEHAGRFLKDVAGEGKQILWVGTKKAATKIIEKAGSDLDMPIVTNRWIGGTLSNNNQIKKAITKLLHLRDVVIKSASNYTKKELSTLQKEIYRLEKNVGGITNLNFPPGAIVVVDAKRERAAIKEAVNTGLPIISIVDTNTDPTGVNFVIPANDDAPKSISFIISYLVKETEEGKKAYKEKTATETKKAVSKKEEPKAEEKPQKETVKTEPVKVEKKEKEVEVKPVEVKPVEEKVKAENKPKVEKKVAKSPAKTSAKKKTVKKSTETSTQPAKKITKKRTVKTTTKKITKTRSNTAIKSAKKK
ncbi:30S ribosomal protein S2 [Candidatus Babeliales bacterium]|nr:30S ribosomal protein S2 [Candidatus Babeliales bacterium]